MFVLVAGILLNVATICYIDPREYEKGKNSRRLKVFFAGGAHLNYDDEHADEAYEKLVAPSLRSVDAPPPNFPRNLKSV